MTFSIQRIEYRAAVVCAIAFVSGLFIRLAQNGITSYFAEKAIDWNGGQYKGNLKDGVPEGEGQFTKNDMTYIGQWMSGELTNGRILSPKYEYEGGIQNLKFQGFGICQYKDGHTYKGYWNQDNKEGLGLLNYADGKMIFAFYKAGIAQIPEGQNYQHGNAVYGIDVSRHQGLIDWSDMYISANNNGGVNGNLDATPKYIQPVLFSFVKSTEGSDIVDTRFSDNYSEAKRCGILRGAYHFLSLKSSGKDQAKNFIDHTILELGDFPPVLDIEKYESAQVNLSDEEFSKIVPIAKEWLQEIEKHYGVKPIIYTNMRTYTNFLKPDAAFGKYYYWIAYPGSTPPEVNNCIIWQFHHHGKIAGIKDNYVDLNKYFGSYSDLKKFVEKEGIK